MRYLLFIWVLSLNVICTQLYGQTIIDLENGGNVRSKNLRDYDKDKLVASKIAEKDSLKYVECLTRGFNALHTDSLKMARTYFTEALALRPSAPGNYIIHKQLALIAEAEGDFHKASQQYTLILKQYPEFHDVRAARASANLQLRHFKESIEDCDVLLKQTVTSVSRERLYFIRASAYMGQRLLKEARQDFEQVSLLNPENLNAPIMIALILHDEGRMQEALNRLNLHLQGHPENIEALLLRASFEEELQQFSLARADYDQAIVLAPERSELYLLRASCLESLGLKELARRDRLKAQSLRR